MWEQFSRTEMLLGSQAMQALAAAHVAVFGVGGVGGYVVEALARSGVGALTLVDADVVDRSNLNRQIIALLPDIGRPKVQVAAERVAAINPEAKVDCRQVFYAPDTADKFTMAAYTYVVDAIDSVPSKLALIQQAQAAGTPIISSMGAGNKLNPMAFRVADIYATSVCPLARVMRQKLRRLGVAELKVVYSTEEPVRCQLLNELSESSAAGNLPPSSVAFVPSAAGLLLAAEVIKDIIAGVKNDSESGGMKNGDRRN